MDVFAVDADAFRFYENDGSPSESTSTPLAAQDTNIERNVGSNTQLHIRYRVQEIGAGSTAGATTDDYDLEWRVNGGGGWNAIGPGTTRVRRDTGSELSDGAATTNRSTNGISDGSGSFFAGEQEEGNGEITDFQHEADNFTEHVWAIELVAADWSTGDFVDLRMRLNGGNPGMDNTAVPRITYPVAAIVETPGVLAAYRRRKSMRTLKRM